MLSLFIISKNDRIWKWVKLSLILEDEAPI